MTTMTTTLSSSLEDYLEAICVLERERQSARPSEIAETLQVRRSSVTGALQALKARGLVNYRPYAHVTLTPSGRSVANRVLRRHEALRDFFVQVLGVDDKEADAAACRMEHGISKSIVDRLVDFAQFVAMCPRAGSRWVRGFADRGHEAPPNPATCESCIRQCLADLKRDQPPSDHSTK